MKQQHYKYFAFISYNSKDTEWGKRIQKKLEGYKMPATLCSEHGWKRKPINPVFFAPTDIQPGGLTEELQERLKSSHNLIVICSPNSAKSEWVGKEIEFFHNLGRTKQIYFFIVGGIPHSGNSDTECFNPVVEKLGFPEILAVNIHEKNYRWPWLNKERAYVQLVTKLLGVEFDDIWQRHKRQLIEKIIMWILGALIVLVSLFYVWRMNRPMDISVGINELSAKNEQLPPLKDAVVTISFDNEQKTDTIRQMSSKAIFTNIPHHFMGQDVRIQVDCKDFVKVDTVMTLAESVYVNIYRDEKVYGDVHFLLWNPHTEKAVGNCELTINGVTTKTDISGHVVLSIPIDKQRPQYNITASIPLESDSIFMPCGDDDVILLK